MTRLRRVLIGTLLAALLATLGITSTSVASERRTYTGTIQGAEYRVEMPERWNGTLVLYSHGYYPAIFVPSLDVANRADTAQWLLDHGYALAASRFQGDGTGYQIKNGYFDQLRLLDWFEANIGHPRRTISYGQSFGGIIATLLVERNPHRFAGAAQICAGFDPLGMYNAALDMQFAVKTLLIPASEQKNIDLVKPRNAQASTDALLAAVAGAVESPQGRAKLALIASFANLVGWWNAHEPRPTDLEQVIRRQALWLQGAFIIGHGPNGHADLERHAGGNPSWNVGIDYRRQLARSSQRDVALRAYRETPGVNLKADLDALARAPRIAPDPAAVRFMYQFGVPRGTTPHPVITTHTTGDGGAWLEIERWYADQVRRSGNPTKLRQLYIERGAHCSVSAAEEITMIESLSHRIDTGHWPNTSPNRLNAVANSFDPRYHKVLDFVTGEDKPMPPAYTPFHPTRPQRPSR